MSCPRSYEMLHLMPFLSTAFCNRNCKHRGQVVLHILQHITQEEEQEQEKKK